MLDKTLIRKKRKILERGSLSFSYNINIVCWVKKYNDAIFLNQNMFCYKYNHNIVERDDDVIT